MKMIFGMSCVLFEGFIIDEKQFQCIDVMIFLMMVKEWCNFKIIDGSCCKCIVQGSGFSVQDINKLFKMYEQMKEMMKMFGQMIGGKGKGM